MDFKIKKPLKDHIIDNFTLVLPYIIIVTILSGVLLSFALNRLDLLIRGLIIAVPAILAAITLHYLYSYFNESKESDYSLLNIKQKHSIKLFSIFYLFSVISLFMYPTRPFQYFVFIVIVYAIIFIQIFSKSSNHYVILSEIYITLLNLIYGVTLKYPLYFGGTDIMGHMFFSRVTFLSGHTIPVDLNTAYANFPLLHILVSEASYLFGYDIRISYFLIAAPIFAFSVFFIYLVMFSLSKDRIVSLLASLIFSSFGITISSGMYVITRTMAFFGFLVLLYLMYNGHSKNSPVFKILAILYGMFIILVHQVSIPQIIAILLFILFVELVMGKLTNYNRKYMDKSFILLLIISFIAYWFYISYAFTESLATMYFDSTHYESVSMKSTIKVGNEWSYLINNAEYSVITFLALIGIGGTLYMHKKSYLRVFALVSLLVLPLYIPTPLQLLWNTMTFFRFDRFILLVSPFMAFIMALGITYLMRIFQYKRVNQRYFYIISLLLLSTLLVFSIISTSPESSYSVGSERRYFDSAEMAYLDNIPDQIPYGSRLYSDYFTRRYIPYQKFSQSETLGLPYYSGSFRTTLDIHNLDDANGYIILRSKALSESGLRLGGGEMVDFRPNQSEWINVSSELEKKDKVYSNSHLEVFY